MSDERSQSAQNSPAEPTRRDRYDERVADRMLRLVTWLHKKGISNLVYGASAATLGPIAYLLCYQLNKITVHGKERVPPLGKGFFLLSNHLSVLDGHVLGIVLLPRTFWFPSKASYYRSFAKALAYTGMTAFRTFPVRRGERDVRAIHLIEDLLRSGKNILLFPEGTRSTPDKLKRGKIGVGKIILDAQPTVVPCYIEGFEKIIPPGRRLPTLGVETHVVFGEPIDMSDLYANPDKRRTSLKAARRVMEHIHALRGELDDILGRDIERPPPPQ